MTNEEFSTFARRLFVQYPSLFDWLKHNSPDPAATQAIWRETLRPFELSEALSVLEHWASSGQTPFKAYERDQVAVIVRSVIAETRSRRDRSRALERETHARAAIRSGRDAWGIIESDPGLAEAFGELKPFRDRFDAGEMSADEYDREHDRILAGMK